MSGVDLDEKYVCCVIRVIEEFVVELRRLMIYNITNRRVPAE